MSSPSPLENCDAVHEENETISIYNCISCNILLNGQAVLLDCLHIICHKCLEEKKSDSGLQCKCLTVTNNFNTQYPIVSPSISKCKICDTCDSIPNKCCVYCKKMYCKPCSKVHSTNSECRTHNPHAIVSYPSKSQFSLCAECSKKIAEVCCTECSVMICSLCHLNSHRNHKYKIIGELCKKVKTSLSEKLLQLNKNNEYMEHALSILSKENQKLEIQKNSVIHEIRLVEQRLHDEIKKRSLQLKKLAENNFIDSINKINKNQEILLDAQSKNKYYMNLVQIILKLGKVNDIVKLSKNVLKQIDEPNQAISMSAKVTGCKIDVKFNSDGSLENCISAIKNVGCIIKTPNNDSEDVINLKTSDSNGHCIMQEENLLDVVTNYSDSDAESDYQPLVECSCCNQWIEKLIQCYSCNRNFHHDCHIPTLPKDIPLQSTWKCTLCQDITRYAINLNQMDMNGEITVNQNERIIMERILMEIYCQNSDSEHYRELPDEEIYPVYYKKVNYPLSLNNVKTRLESQQSYTSLIRFLKDLKHVFQNGLNYYSKSDPYHRSAENLKLLLERLINKWIPKLSDDNRLC